MARALVIVPYPLDSHGVAQREAQQTSVSFGPNIDFEYRAVKAGPRLGETQHDAALFEFAIFEAGCEAEAEGFDAVCVDTVSDSGVKPLRATLSIPVVGAGATQYHLALMLGTRFSVLTQWDRWVRETEAQVAEYGLSDRCASVRTIGVAPDPARLLTGQDQLLPAMLEEASRCIEDGADVLCLGSTTMHQAAGYLNERLPIPVINPGPLTYKLVELLLALDLGHSKLAYPTPDHTEAGLLHAMLDAAAEYRANGGPTPVTVQ